MAQPHAPQPRPKVALLVTCLVDLFRPSIGFAAIDLLERAGCRVEVPASQTCCGQPAHNAGDESACRSIAARVIAAFADYDYVVAPSGSCAAMLSRHYPDLFATDPELSAAARKLAARTHELTAFLVDVMGADPVAANWDGICAYHDGCSGLNELGIREQPRRLLKSVAGLRLRERAGAQVCCGFGGTFCVSFGQISTRMAGDCATAHQATGAQLLLGGDLGCLLNLAGWLKRQGSSMEVRHVAELLAGRMDAPAIGQAPGDN